MQSITIRRPDDWHLHLRDGAMLEGVIADTSRTFARAIIMPNLCRRSSRQLTPRPIASASSRPCLIVIVSSR